MLEQALERMPHRGAMRLIQQIVDTDEGRIVCLAKPHGHANYPLRLNGVLHAAALIELGAQAAAAHASMYGIGAAHTGLVLSISGVEIGQNSVPNDGNLSITAHRLRALDLAAGYQFAVNAQDVCIISGEILLSMVRKDT